MKRFTVCRYFDDVFEAVVAAYDTEEEARSEAKRRNDEKARCYVEFLVRENKEE